MQAFIFTQARSQEFALGGGLLWRLEKTSKDFDPDFNPGLIRLSRFFRQNQVISKKKKVFIKFQSVFRSNFRWCPKKLQFCGLNHSKSFTTSHRQSQWGVGSYFHLWSKIGLKSTKIVVFCILYRPLAEYFLGLRPPWLHYCLYLHLYPSFGALKIINLFREKLLKITVFFNDGFFFFKQKFWQPWDSNPRLRND